MVKFEDFKDAEGKIDWKAYDKAKTDNGDNCKTCGHWLLFGGKGYPQDCVSCMNLKAGVPETSHEKFIRCPACGLMVQPDWEYSIWEEGEHDVTCNECGKDYTVETCVTYSFTCIDPDPTLDNDDE